MLGAQRTAAASFFVQYIDLNLKRIYLHKKDTADGLTLSFFKPMLNVTHLPKKMEGLRPMHNFYTLYEYVLIFSGFNCVAYLCVYEKMYLFSFYFSVYA
jgi:hypothetical protein